MPKKKTVKPKSTKKKKASGPKKPKKPMGGY